MVRDVSTNSAGMWYPDLFLTLLFQLSHARSGLCRCLASYVSNYGSFKTTADWMTIKPYQTCQVAQLVILEFLPPDREQDRGIMVACEENDDKLLEQHLNQPRNPNFEDADQRHRCVRHPFNGSLKCVSLLVEAGANKDQGTTDDGATPLLIAARNGHLEVVRFLVESGANKDQGTTNDGATPLFIAAHQGYLEVVRFLVESGANEDQGMTDYGGTPLYIAAVEGHLEVVRFQVESGANKDQGTTDDGTTPLFIAAQEGYLELVRFLVGSGANTDQVHGT